MATREHFNIDIFDTASDSHDDASCGRLLPARLTARDQFLALAASSLPRCGRRSPARHLSLACAPMLRALWDWCTATERGALVDVTMRTARGVACARLAIGVSHVLASLTSVAERHSVEPLQGAVSKLWVDPDRYLAQVGDSNPTTFSYRLRDRFGSPERDLIDAAVRMKCATCERWCVVCGSGVAAMQIVILALAPQLREACCALGGVEQTTITVPAVDRWEHIQCVVFNKSNPNEVMLAIASTNRMVTKSSVFSFVFFDVSQTFMAKCLVETRQKIEGDFPSLKVIKCALLMKQKSGEPMLIVQDCLFQVFKITANPAKVELFAESTDSLVQVSHTSLFCIGDASGLLLITHKNSKKRCNKVELIEPITGTVVLQLDVEYRSKVQIFSFY
ncbi:hypothetical protein Pelo_4978 [Pelomyxa schiedti]|nr:hypothetical protein Pelo_4978 [Pelomyxa schiedti]